MPRLKHVKLKCYFAHPFETRGSPEEKEILEELESRRLNVHEPFTEEDCILKKYGKTHYYMDGKPIYFELAREIWTKDLGAIKNSDIVVAYLPNRQIGTSMEVAVAYEYKKFIQIISPIKHPSFAVYADQLFETIADWKRYKEVKWVNYGKRN
jgi:nucleoside 2-deoxyribosyltransferase